jgi:hypothetical protein
MYTYVHINSHKPNLLQHGLVQWEEHLKDSDLEMRDTIIGSARNIDVALTQAYRALSYEIG